MRGAETPMGVDGYTAAKAGKLCDLQYGAKRNAVNCGLFQIVFGVDRPEL